MELGRKPSIDDELIINSFLDAIRLGFSDKKACDYAMISTSSLYNWIRKAESDEEDGIENSKYVKFLHMFKKARADFVYKHIKRITDASEQSWQASAWLLERRCPDDFTQNKQIAQNEEPIVVENNVPMISNNEVENNG